MLNQYLESNVFITLEGVLGIILVDVVLGALVSLKSGNFSFSKLPRFVETNLIPYTGGLLILALFSNANTELRALFFTIAATVTAKFLLDIRTKIRQLFNSSEFQNQTMVTAVVNKKAAVSYETNGTEETVNANAQNKA